MRQGTKLSQLGRLGITLAVAMTLAGPALANTAARVDFAIGAVTATGKDGQARQLIKGGEVLSGDRVVTANGRAQLHFTDGAFVSLQPNTTFEVREYRYEGKTDGSEKGIFGLLRGAMRTVTGLIGRVNRSAYQIQTPTATVGIRGTGGIIEVLADGTTRITGDSGIWVLKKKNYEALEVPAGTVGEAIGADQRDVAHFTVANLLDERLPGGRVARRVPTPTSRPWKRLSRSSSARRSPSRRWLAHRRFLRWPAPLSSSPGIR